MRILALIFILSITCASKTDAQVINYEIDPEFNSELLINRGNVNDILTLSNGDIMVSSSALNLGAATPLIVLSESGDLEYNIFSGGSIGPLRLNNFKQHYIYYGGSIRWFDVAGNNLGFNFEYFQQPYSGPLSNVALDALVLPDDHILVAGRFFTDSTLMGTDQSHLALRQLCIIDSTGAPVPDFPMLRCAWPTDAYISTIHKLSTGEYIVAGSFDEVDGYYCPKLAKLNADFSVNMEFISPFSEQGSSVGIRMIDSQDRIWVSYNSGVIFSDFPDYLSKLARIFSHGELDTSYLAPVFLTYTGSDPDNPTNPFNEGPIILEDTDGTFILGGSFIEVNGEPYNRLIKINDAVEVIEGAFGGIGPDEATWGTWTSNIGPIAGTFIRVLRKLPDGKLLLGGQFSSFGGEPYSCLVRLQPNGFVGTENSEDRGKLKLWPNPALDYVQVSLPDVNERIERIEIYDLQGRFLQLKSNTPNTFNSFDVQNLIPGIYVVKAYGNQKVYSQKLVIGN